MRIVFAGTPEFARAALRALVEHGHKPVAVYTQPDRPAGRGRKLRASVVKEYAESRNLPVFQPATLKNDEEQEGLSELAPDLMVVAAYGLILPPKILGIPRFGCINVHASLLPRWRGAAPIQRAILAGDLSTGITIMQMDAGLDTGDMLLKKETAIRSDETAGGLHDRLGILGGDALLEALGQIAAGTQKREPQDDRLATYAQKITTSETYLNWTESAEELARQVRAFNPVPGARARFGEADLKIWKAEAADGELAPGVLASPAPGVLMVGCRSGVLRLDEIQLPGRARVDARDFLNAHPEGGRLE